jgi:isopenicillin-N epimerase
MAIHRRRFLSRTSLGALAIPACRSGGAGNVALNSAASLPEPGDWAAIRNEFLLSRDHIHLALMLLTSHPRVVREAIERHRRHLDENPVEYFESLFGRTETAIRATAASYFGGTGDDVALTDSTTMGLGVLYGGLPLAAGQEVLTTTHDHYSTHESLRLHAARSGAVVRKVPLYDTPATASADALVGRLVAAVSPKTRVVAVTWVHSSTGVKLPIRQMATALAALNARRDPADRFLFCVDGVHGVGVERETAVDLGCDFLVAGCHKWLFGPRGTGIVWGKREAWRGHRGLVAPFEEQPYTDWMKGLVPGGPPGPLASPGGFHSFEHRWSLGEAFRFHQHIGRARITERIHALASQAKEGLAVMKHVTLHTPRADTLSAALVCFEVKGVPAPEVVKRLQARKIITSVTPYATAYARLSPGILNTPEEIETTLREIRALA